MNDCAFYYCKQFLEYHISELPENAELVKAYICLIEQKTKFDIALCSQNAEVQKRWNDNQIDLNKHWQTTKKEIAEKQIECANRQCS